MRKKMDGYWELFKKGQYSNKKPKTNTLTNPTSIERAMEEFLNNTGRFFKDHMDGGAPGGG